MVIGADHIQVIRDGVFRTIVGYGFMAHGFAKLTRGPETFAVVLHTLGVPLPVLGAWATTLVEIFGGAAVFTGLLIPIASIPMAVVLLTAWLRSIFLMGPFR
jgi:putative oxidoreductase